MIHTHTRKWRAILAVLLVGVVVVGNVYPILTRYSGKALLGRQSVVAVLLLWIVLFVRSSLARWVYRAAYDGAPDGWLGFRGDVLNPRAKHSVNRTARDAAIEFLERTQAFEKKYSLSSTDRDRSLINLSELVVRSQNRDEFHAEQWSLLAVIRQDPEASEVLLGVFQNTVIEFMPPLGPTDEMWSRAIDFLRSDEPYAWSYAWLDSPGWLGVPLNRPQLAALRFWPYHSLETFATSATFQRKFGADEATRTALALEDSFRSQMLASLSKSADDRLEFRRTDEPNA